MTTDGASLRLNWYKTLGIFVGRALLDSRIIDLNLNPVFVNMILGQPVKKNIATLKRVDTLLARSLEKLQSYLNARKEIESLPLVRSECVVCRDALLIGVRDLQPSETS